MTFLTLHQYLCSSLHNFYYPPLIVLSLFTVQSSFILWHLRHVTWHLTIHRQITGKNKSHWNNGNALCKCKYSHCLRNCATSRKVLLPMGSLGFFIEVDSEVIIGVSPGGKGGQYVGLTNLLPVMC
jgi:hypothetical protein